MKPQIKGVLELLHKSEFDNKKHCFQMQWITTNDDKWGVGRSLVHYSACSSPTEAASYSTIQLGGRVDGQVTPPTMSCNKPIKIMPQARLSILILN
jgi:hypothetical protein